MHHFALTNDPHVTKYDIEQRFLAGRFVENSCPVRLSVLWKELSNSGALKMDKYPKLLSEATYLLIHWKPPVASNRIVTRDTGDNQNNDLQLSFMQNDDPIQCTEIIKIKTVL